MLTFLPLLLALQAVSHLIPAPGFNGRGEIFLIEKDTGQIVLTGNFEGLTPGRHALQLHAEGCSTLLKRQSAGAHYNPLPVQGCDASLAILDIGELEANQQGKATFEATLENVHLEGEDSIVGYSLVVHPVGLTSPSELRGAKAAPIACGIIKKSP
jgi:Cu-Zn family superoxide dismutase